MKVRFTHPWKIDVYLAEIDPKLTAKQALTALHSLETGPFLPPVQVNEHERLYLHRTGEVIDPGRSMGSAGVIDGDILDVNRVNLPLSETDLNWPGLFIANRKYRRGITSEDFQEHVEDCVRSYVRQSLMYKRLYYLFQVIIVAGAATASVSLAIPQTPFWIPAILSGAVTITTGISTLSKFGERSHNLRLAAQDMQHEYQRFITGRGQYRDMSPIEAFHAFMDRIENFGREYTQHSLAIEVKMASQDKIHGTEGSSGSLRG